MMNSVCAFQIEQWLEYCQYFSKEYDIGEICERINSHLALRSYMIGPELTIVDLAIWEQITSNCTLHDLDVGYQFLLV